MPRVPWVRAKVAAAAADVSLVTLYDWIRRGSVVAKLFADGRALRVKVDAEGMVIDGPGRPPPWAGKRGWQHARKQKARVPVGARIRGQRPDRRGAGARTPAAR